MDKLIRLSGISFATRVAGLAVAFAANVLLARLLGANGFGAYAIAIAWASVLAIPSRMGLDNAALRFVTVYRERGEIGALRGFLGTSGRTIAAISVVAGGAAVVAGLIAGRREMDPWLAVGVGLLVLPLAAMGWLSSVVRAFNRIFAAQAYEQLLRPSLLIVLLGSAWTLGRQLDERSALALTVIALVIPLALLGWQVRREVAALGPAAADYSERHLWVSVSWPLFLLSLFQEASNQVDVILLGILKDAVSAAHFSAAARLGSLSAFGLVAIATVAAPAIASAFHRGDRETLSQLATQTARLSLLFAMVVIVALLVFGRVLLAAFGSSFEEAYPVLVILLAGGVVNAFTGNVANYMLMTGHQRPAAAIMAAALAVSAVLDCLLIPTFGAVGAAVGSVAGVSAWNLAMVVYVRRHLGIDASAIGRRPRTLVGEQRT